MGEANEHGIGIEALREVCNLTVELTRLRQNECKHLCVEDIAPRLFLELVQRTLPGRVAAEAADRAAALTDVQRYLVHFAEQNPVAAAAIVDAVLVHPEGGVTVELPRWPGYRGDKKEHRSRLIRGALGQKSGSSGSTID